MCAFLFPAIVLFLLSIASPALTDATSDFASLSSTIENATVAVQDSVQYVMPDATNGTASNSTNGTMLSTIEVQAFRHVHRFVSGFSSYSFSLER